MQLAAGFKVIDFQATPSGYYQIIFRSDKGETVVVTQHGRGGSNFTTPPLASFEIWLGANDQMAIDSMDEMGFHDLAVAVAERTFEWQDTVVLAIANAVEMGLVRVEG